MIIVNQDRSSIYNLNCIKSIDRIENEIYITDDILANKGTLIGVYKTEERARKVLEEIIKSATAKQVDGKRVTRDEFFMIMKSLEFNWYEMPLE